MKTYELLAVSVLIFTFTLFSCGGDSAQDAGDQETFTNPFTYCKAVGTVDQPGENYIGEKVPSYIAKQLKIEFGASESMPNDLFMEGTYWRCMDGSVYACNVGNNLPCLEKADVSTEPNEGMVNYCKENPDAEFIPAFAQGRTTVYEWKCSGTKPEIVKQLIEVDAAGFQKNFWYKIKSPEDLSQKNILRQ